MQTNNSNYKLQPPCRTYTMHFRLEISLFEIIMSIKDKNFSLAS